MKTNEEIQNILRYELKMNQLILMPIMIQKQSLMYALANTIGLQQSRLHEIICECLQQSFQKKNLPRKLIYIEKDKSILEDYIKYPYLVNFSKITLEMVSQIYETKITMYSLNLENFLTGFIINEKGYQQELKLANINNIYYEVKDANVYHCASTGSSSAVSIEAHSRYAAYQNNLYTHNNNDSSNSQSYNQIFDHFHPELVLTKRIQTSHQISGTNENQIPKKNTHAKTMVDIPNGLKKSISMIENLSFQNQIDLKTNEPGDNTQGIVNQSQPEPKQHNLFEGLQSSENMQGQEIVEGGGQISHDYNTMNEQYQQYMEMYGYEYYQNYYYQQQQPYSFRNNSTKQTYSMYPQMSPPKNLSKRQLSTSGNQSNMSTLEIKQNERYTGKLKFFDQVKNYGFIIMDADSRDIFVHCDDLQKAGISKQRVKSYKQSEGSILFSFKVMEYIGKYDKSRKAVDLIIIEDDLVPGLYNGGMHN